MSITQLFQNITGEQIVFAIYAIIHAILLFSKWKWIASALTENSNPSALRLSGFMFVNTICFCVVGHCCLNWTLETTILGYLLIATGALYGIIKAAQVLALRGIKDPEVKEDNTNTQNQ